MARLKLAVLVSGRGSNLQAILDACAGRRFPAEVCLVFSNDPQAYALTRAEAAGVPVATLAHKGFPGGRTAFDREVGDMIAQSGADLVVLAGYMRLLSPDFVQRFEGRLINIHPSLLPAFKGLKAHRQALDAGVRFSGCTVHFVTAEMDAGPIIAQAAVPVHIDDDERTLSQRILKAEHRLYPHAIRMIAEGRARLGDDGRVRLDDCAAPKPAHVINPMP